MPLGHKASLNSVLIGVMGTIYKFIMSMILETYSSRVSRRIKL